VRKGLWATLERESQSLIAPTVGESGLDLLSGLAWFIYVLLKSVDQVKGERGRPVGPGVTPPNTFESNSREGCG
jgi:hypothetical protein